MKTVTAREILNVAKIGETVELVYPASDGSGDSPRRGVVEKVVDKAGLLVVKVGDKEFRSFKIARIVGDVKILF